MPPKKRWDRCCNPLHLANHKKSTGLRRASENLCAKWSLTREDYLCPSCRLTLTETAPPQTDENASVVVNPTEGYASNQMGEDSDNDSILENSELATSRAGPSREFDNREADDIVNVEKDPTAEASQASSSQQFISEATTTNSDLNSSQKMFSQLSIGTRLPVINDALTLLDESPIPKKKLRASKWIDDKVERVCRNLKRTLQVANSEPAVQCDTRDLLDIIDRLKEKLHHEETTRAEKIQILTIVPQYWSIERICETMEVTRSMAKAAKKLAETGGILSMPDAKAGRPIAEETKKEVLHFYNDDRVSVNMPGMKDYVSVRNDENKRIHVQKRLILSNLKELLEMFRSEYPDTTIGFSMFASMRPKHCVLAGASGTHTVCVCSMHQNVKLMMTGCDLKALTKDTETSLNHYTDCLALVTCQDSSSECHLGACTNCPGTKNLQMFLDKIFDENDIDVVTYKYWATKPRTSLTTVTKDSLEFVAEFCEKIQNLLPHSYIAKEQANFIKTLKESLETDEFLVVCDFAENYAFVIQDAAPAFHWNNDQATIYPVVIYFKSDGVIEHRSLVIISDCLTHDSVAVYTFSKIIIDFIKSISPTASKGFYFSDGAPQQFKNIKNFLNLYYHKEDYGIAAEWHFFATAHGKGPCDGIGGTIKRMAARASLQLPPDRQITNPQELYEWASRPSNLPNITVKFSPASQYDEAKHVLEPRFKTGKPIPGTQKIHCVVPQENGNMSVKPFSAYGNPQFHSVLKKAKKL